VKKFENTSDPTNGICSIDGSHAWVYRTFLQHDFSAIPSGAEILSATLKVFVSSGNDNYTSSRCYVGRMLGEWAEDAALTWSNQPGHQSYSSESSETPQVSPSIGASNWIEVDITTVVREWYDGAYPNHGIVIRAIEEGSYRTNWDIRNRRHSDEYATRVEVTYRVANFTPVYPINHSYYLYNGVPLPAIPADALTKYPCAAMRKNLTTGHYDLILSPSVLYWENGGLSLPSDTCKWYRVEIASIASATEWSFYTDYNSVIGITTPRPLVWSNHDIRLGSATAEEIYFSATAPVPIA
jgi:hypothetical protein